MEIIKGSTEYDASYVSYDLLAGMLFGANGLTNSGRDEESVAQVEPFLGGNGASGESNALSPVASRRQSCSSRACSNEEVLHVAVGMKREGSSVD